MASNRFAALSPDFEEDEAQRKKVADAAKAKKEQAVAKSEEHPKAHERKFEGQRGEERSTERGRGRGTRPYRGARGGRRGRGGYTNEGEGEFQHHGPHKDNFKYPGDPNAKHPFDRKSGTGRGTEVSKAGAGKANWGTPADDIKDAQKPEEKPEGEVVEHKEGEEKQEEKKEAPKEEEAPVLTLSEYNAMIAEKTKGLTTKKADLALQKDPKASGLVAYDKKVLTGISEAASKKKEAPKKTKEEEDQPSTAILGTVIGHDAPKHFRKFDKKPEETTGTEGEKRSPEGGRRGRGRGRGGYRGEQHEAKKAEATPFVMKEEEFPALK